MDIFIGKSKWEMWDDDLNTFLVRVKKDGFSSVEIYLKSLKESVSEINSSIQQSEMLLVGQILTEGKTYQDHINSLESQFELAYKLSPSIINTHAGKDIFTFNENVEVFKRLITLSKESGIPIYVETHRGRPTYSAIETRKYLEELPDLQITADFSHWMVVHESDLSDQTETMELAIKRSGYIHARPGYPEGPQITDPRAPEWNGIVQRYFSLWQKIIDYNSEKGKNFLIITPEFGPPDYMHTMPFTNKPIADVWELNVHMRERLIKELSGIKNITQYS